MLTLKDMLNHTNVSDLIKRIESSDIIESLSKIPENQRYNEFMEKTNIGFLSEPESSYIIYYFNKKINLGICEHFKVNENYLKTCTLGEELQTTCSGVDNLCSWRNLDRKIKKLDEKGLKIYYDFWTKIIAERYGDETIKEHLEKHLKEEVKDYREWITSAENLVDISEKVKDTDKSSALIERFKLLVLEYRQQNEITAKEKVERLLNHLRNHLLIATPLPDIDIEGDKITFSRRP